MKTEYWEYDMYETYVTCGKCGENSSGNGRDWNDGDIFECPCCEKSSIVGCDYSTEL